MKLALEAAQILDNDEYSGGVLRSFSTEAAHPVVLVQRFSLATRERSGWLSSVRNEIQSALAVMSITIHYLPRSVAS